MLLLNDDRGITLNNTEEFFALMFTWTPYKHAIIAYIWRENMLKNLSAKSFPRASLFENCELRGTGTVEGPRSEHIFKVKWGLLCLFILQNLFTTCGIRKLGNIT